MPIFEQVVHQETHNPNQINMMQLTRRFTNQAGDLFSEFDRLFRHSAERFTNRSSLPREFSLYEYDVGIELSIALPGTRKEDLDLTFRDRILTLRAQRQDSIPEGWTARQESPRPESYELRVRLHASLDPAKTTAELKDGLLRLHIGKREEALPRKIEVQ